MRSRCLVISPMPTNGPIWLKLAVWDLLLCLGHSASVWFMPYMHLLVLFCHRKWFASLFLVILPINLTSSSQFWRKLLFFLRRVTYFVLAKQIWIPYDQNTIFFLRRISIWRQKVGSIWKSGLKSGSARFAFIWKLYQKVGRKVSIFVLAIRN